MQTHRPEWPDKALFAALLLIIGGSLGGIFASLALAGFAELHFPSGLVLPFLEDYPPTLQLGLSLLTIVFGVLSYRRQAVRWSYLGAATGVLSFGALGVVSLLSLGALANIFRSWREGEETRDDGVTLPASEWPDKSIIASLFLDVGAVVLFVQGFSILVGKFDPVWLDRFLGDDNARWATAGYDLVLSVFALWVSRRVFYQSNAPLGWAAAALMVVSCGFYVLGPILSAIAMVYLALANKEGEFAPHMAAARAPTKRRKAAKAT